MPHLASNSATAQSLTLSNAVDRLSVWLMSNTLEVGGSERQFAAIVESLNRDQFDVHAACLRRVGGLAERVGEIPEFPPGGRLVGIPAQRAQLAMVRRMRRERIAVAHAFDFYTNLMLIPAARVARIPVIGSHRQVGDLLTKAQFKAQAWTFRLCERVVCNSRAAAASLRDVGLPESSLEVIPNGLAESAFAECMPALPRTPGIVRIGMIARMNSAVKNHAAFLKAAASLLGQAQSVEFVLVGDGPLRPELERMAAELQIRDRVRFLGERHDIPEILASLDVSVLISSSESLSNVILESMAAGVAVVATNVGGNPELVRDRENGLLVSLGDEAGLVNALAHLASDGGCRAQYGARARQFVHSHFRMDLVCRRFEQLYLSLAKKDTRRGN